MVRVRETIKSFVDLEVWKLGKRLSVMAYKLTDSFPDREIYGLANQIRRAAVSIPANVAEGFGRYHYLERVKFFLNVRGSLNELKCHLLIARELGLREHALFEPALQQIETLSVKLNNFISTTRKSQRLKPS